MWPFTSSPPADQATASSTPASTSAAIPESACPVDHSTRSAWATQAATSAAQTSIPPQQLSTGSTNYLSTEREVSSIPRWLPASNTTNSTSASSTTASPSADSDIPPSACPAHSKLVASSTSSSPATTTGATAPEENWVYPSPSSFHSALQRKSRPANPNDMPIVVPIHNAVNEKVWHDVLEWERLALGKKQGEEVPSKLVSFVGKPKLASPRARWRSLIGYTPPFDRHDWIVDRPLPSTSESPNPGSIRVRYVIDFYTGKGAGLLQQDSGTGSTPNSEQYMRPNLAFFIDCRPAFDGWEGFRMRFDKVREDWLGSTRTGTEPVKST